ncbi:MAG TPA: thiamine-phosphate kinase [Gammaproteobacteria bacterium]|nr:thiamine-phosphate kinase [Gammaproteobacteria bacterium]
MTSEFDIIARFFRHTTRHPAVVLGIGDDAALLRVPPGQRLAVAVDTLVSGRHFLPDTDPSAIGHKALAVNLSDLAAMGAQPAWATLALTLPEADETWLAGFAEGFFGLADRYGVELVGGDTTRGPLTVSVQCGGQVAGDRALCRNGARPGQRLFVTGTPGDAALALHMLQSGARLETALRNRLDRPEPRVAFGAALAGLASAAIDISDGLLADLSHLLEASGCGVRLDPQAVPRSRWLAAAEPSLAQACAFNGGDDYELLFSVEPDQVSAIQALARETGVPVAEIGVLESTPGIRPPELSPTGYDHFRDPDKP